jgi:transcriptional regulator with XRE-family HTH domain
VPRTAHTDRHCLTNQLRDIVESRGLTAYRVGRLAGVDPGVVQRFLTGQRDIRMETADRIATALGLRLVEVGTRSRRRSATAAGDGSPTDGHAYSSSEASRHGAVPAVTGSESDSHAP